MDRFLDECDRLHGQTGFEPSSLGPPVECGLRLDTAAQLVESLYALKLRIAVRSAGEYKGVEGKGTVPHAFGQDD